VLQARLSELRQANLVELVHREGYRLTAMGRELQETVLPLYHFAGRWNKAR
jgi:DNA-binding HxlR family transcriptional regulator